MCIGDVVQEWKDRLIVQILGLIVCTDVGPDKEVPFC